MKLAPRIGLAAVSTLIASSVHAQNAPNWTYIGSSASNDVSYLDTANIIRDGVYARHYVKLVEPDGYFRISYQLADCSNNYISILSITDYSPSGRSLRSLDGLNISVAALPETVGWSMLQTACSTYRSQYTSNYSPNRGGPLGNGALMTNSPDSYINVRERPARDARVSRRGMPGDEVVIWDSTFVEGYTWYKVALRGSNATGWVREDLVQFYD